MTSHPVSVGDPQPVDVSLFTFHGFGSLRDTVLRRLRRVGLRAGDPAMAVVDGAIFRPEVHPRGTERVEDGGERSTDGNDDRRLSAIDATNQTGDRHTGGLPESAGTPMADVDQEVVYLGWLFDSYGHVLLESLARTWILPEVDRSTRVVFHRPNPVRLMPQEWTLRILAAFGVTADRLHLVDRPTRFRRAIIPQPVFEPPHVAFARAAALYQGVARGITARTTPSTQPLYLSRRLLPSSQRAIIGEAQVEDVLRENGFLVAHPETMTFEDQVRLVNAHTDIFTAAGSTAHNVLFALHQPRLHVLTNEDRISPNFFLCSALAEAPTAFINCLGTGDRVPVGGTMSRRTPEVVATAKLIEYIDERGLLKSRVRAAMADRDPALRRAFDESWCYASVRACWKGAALPEAVEREAMVFARQSWPVSLALARYYAYARRNSTRLDDMAQQFADLAAAEYDINRLAAYRADVEESLASILNRCQPETRGHVAKVVMDHFLPDLVTSRDADREGTRLPPAHLRSWPDRPSRSPRDDASESGT